MNTQVPRDMQTSVDSEIELRQMLVDSARRWCESANNSRIRAQVSAHIAGCPPERWQELADMGWVGMHLPQEDGGLGAGLIEICLLAEQLGRALLVEPFVSCAVLGAGLFESVARGEGRAQWLPAFAAGQARVVWLAWSADGDAQLQAATTAATPAAGGGWQLTGRTGTMPGAAGADAYLLLAQLKGLADQTGLFLVQADASGAVVEPFTMYDGRHAGRLTLDNSDGHLLEAGPTATMLARLQVQLDRGLIAHCAETLGSAQAALEITIEYLKTRRQFGRAISDNQVIQHRLVDLYVEQQEARALCLAAAERPEPHLAAALGLRTADVARHTWEEAIQLHGAIGMTEEYAVGEYVRRLALAANLYGTPVHHAERLAALSLGAIS